MKRLAAWFCQSGMPGTRHTLKGRSGWSGPLGGSMASTGDRTDLAHFKAFLIQGWDRSWSHIKWSSSEVMIRSTGAEGSSDERERERENKLIRKGKFSTQKKKEKNLNCFLRLFNRFPASFQCKWPVLPPSKCEFYAQARSGFGYHQYGREKTSMQINNKMPKTMQKIEMAKKKIKAHFWLAWKRRPIFG